ncbi:hypothetical protein J7382_13735 [Shimia sp. R11_0]|nr:hypothetical protein [Shimia sp. R11_0]
MADVVLILGSGPNAVSAKDWPRSVFDAVVSINNAWRIRKDWTHLIHPEDFPEDRQPNDLQPTQKRVQHTEYVPQNNAFGGVLFAGGTMAFTAGYWALGALKPKVMAFIGCDMVYPKSGQTHFYGNGVADPLRADVSLQSLEGKAARLGLIAAQSDCRVVNLSVEESRLVFPRATIDTIEAAAPRAPCPVEEVYALRRAENALGYDAPSGRYWEIVDRIESSKLAAIDAQWLALWEQTYSP